MSFKRIILGAAALLAIMAPLTASAANAASTPNAIFFSTLTNRPDSGGNGNWAIDDVTRTLAITHVSGNSYTATVTDTGGFQTIPGGFTPNQTATPGVRFTKAIEGTVKGGAFFSFTASKGIAFAALPTSAAILASEPTSTWYKLAFPAGTVFGGTGILNNWGWTYVTDGCMQFSGHALSTVTQQWIDAASNNGGQGPGTPAPGNITNFSPACLG